MEWVKINHPFHPYYGKRFKVLKERKVSGKDTLILQDKSGNTFSVDWQWTDQYVPALYEDGNTSWGILSVVKLLELIELLEAIENKSK